MAAVSVVTVAALALAVRWSARSRPEGYRSPADCVDAYCNASKDGSAERYLDCLAEPLRSETGRRFADLGQLGEEYLRLGMQDVRSWAQHYQPATGSAAVIELEEVRDSSRRLTRFHLEN